MRETQSFTIRRARYLADDGQLLETLPESLTEQRLCDAYRTMVLVRLFDSKAIALQRTGKLGTYPSILGQEAISTAIGLCMQPDDVLAPYYRDTGAQILRGVGLDEILAYWGGDERGSAFQHCPHDFPVAVPIATQIAHAAGAAAALKIRGVAQAVVTTCGDGATSKGDFLESLNVAGAWQLPLVMVVNNNHWAISVSRAQQCHAPTLAQKAIGAGVPGVHCDGNDLIGLLVVIEEALERARLGKGPTLIEAESYRLGDHTTADDARRYRPRRELDQAWSRDPITRMRQFLEQRGWWDAEKEQTWMSCCQETIQESVELYLARTPQPATAMFDTLYAELPAAYADQYAELQQLHG